MTKEEAWEKINQEMIGKQVDLSFFRELFEKGWDAGYARAKDHAINGPCFDEPKEDT